MSKVGFWKPKLDKIKRYVLYPDTYLNFFPSLFRLTRFDKDPIFICGAPRSGTTLLLSVLDAHPEIFCIPFETMLFCRRPPEKRLFRNERLHIAFTKLQLTLYLLAQRIPSGSRRWCEKTPHNVHNIDFILRAFRNRVKVIHIYRDGRDVVTSVHGRVNKTIVTPEGWAKCIRAGLAHKDASNVYHLRYESLVEDFENEVKKLLDFLGAAFTTSVRNFHDVSNINENESLVDSHGYQGSFRPRPIDRDSVGKWKKNESAHVLEFMANEECVELLRQLNYT